MTDAGWLLIFFALCLVLTGIIVLIKALAWVSERLEAAPPVKHSRVRYVPSPTPSLRPSEPSEPSVLEADADRAQPPSPPPGMIPIPPRAVLLDICKSLRSHNYSRDDGRAIFKMFGVPLANDIWADAAPPPPAALSPIARRPIDPSRYHEDDELKYAPPPA